MVVFLVVERKSGPGGKVDLLTGLGVVGEPVHLVVVEPDKVPSARGHIEASGIKSFSHNLTRAVPDVDQRDVAAVVVVPDRCAGVLGVIADKHPFGKAAAEEADACEPGGGQRNDRSLHGEIDGG